MLPQILSDLSIACENFYQSCKKVYGEDDGALQCKLTTLQRKVEERDVESVKRILYDLQRDFVIPSMDITCESIALEIADLSEAYDNLVSIILRYRSVEQSRLIYNRRMPPSILVSTEELDTSEDEIVSVISIPTSNRDIVRQDVRPTLPIGSEAPLPFPVYSRSDFILSITPISSFSIPPLTSLYMSIEEIPTSPYTQSPVFPRDRVVNILPEVLLDLVQ